MIPLGNWQERIDELESENFDLLEENRRLDGEVTDLLYEIDTLKDKLSRAQEEQDRAEKEAREAGYGWHEEFTRAEKAERRAEIAEVLTEDYRAANDAWRESFEITLEAYDEVQARANSWFEVAKSLVRSRDFWIKIADQEMQRADKAENTVDELKSALRVLGS